MEAIQALAGVDLLVALLIILALACITFGLSIALVIAVVPRSNNQGVSQAEPRVMIQDYYNYNVNIRVQAASGSQVQEPYSTLAIPEAPRWDIVQPAQTGKFRRTTILADPLSPLDDARQRDPFTR